MNKEGYAEYEKTVKEFFSHGLTNLLQIDDSEPYFSWHHCECCGRPEGGNRYDCDGYNEIMKEVEKYAVCEDCLYYAEYGQLDDMTMIEINKEKGE